jgi:hypothetical protein
MNQDFDCSWAIKLDSKHDQTLMGLNVAIPGGIQDFENIDWKRYFEDCRASLRAVASKHGLEIIVWSIDFDEQYTSISHSVAVRGVLFGALPLQLVRAIRPTGDYRMLGFLARAIRKDWRLDLSKVVESQKLCRYERRGTRLEDAVASQLLMSALNETRWHRLIRPSAKPWAYINTATKRIYERYYKNKNNRNDRTLADDGDLERYDASADNGDELHIPDIPKTLRAAGFPNDAIAVLNAKAQGRRSDLRLNLTDGAGNSMSARQVEALKRTLRRGKKRMREVAMAASTWKSGSSKAMVYRERVPDGKLWGGSWTYAHKFQGRDVDILQAVMCHERRNLYKN